MIELSAGCKLTSHWQLTLDTAKVLCYRIGARDQYQAQRVPLRRYRAPSSVTGAVDLAKLLNQRRHIGFRIPRGLTGIYVIEDEIQDRVVSNRLRIFVEF